MSGNFFSRVAVNIRCLLIGKRKNNLRNYDSTRYKENPSKSAANASASGSQTVFVHI